uniref:E4 protein n=1 Tax=Human papillomavirus TaxID=10566 RepID=A0A386H743_9PAPI|nr:MAG: E4 protein [Human papillomavirus]
MGLLLMFTLIITQKIHILIQVGTHYMYKMRMIIGIKLQGKLTLMVYIMKINKEIKTTLLYFLLMPKGMVLLDSGLFIIKMKLCLPLPLLVHQTRSPDLFKGLQRSPPPPGTPHPLRKLPDDKKQKRDDLARPPARRHLNYDQDDDEEDPNKENLDPKEEERRKLVLGYLLDKWADDILHYQDLVLQDLADLKKRLGIPQ